MCQPLRSAHYGRVVHYERILLGCPYPILLLTALRYLHKLRGGGVWGGRVPTPKGYPASPQDLSFPARCGGGAATTSGKEGIWRDYVPSARTYDCTFPIDVLSVQFLPQWLGAEALVQPVAH